MADAPKPPTKTEIFNNIAQATDLSKKQIAAVFDALSAEVAKAVGDNGAKAFTIPGLCKVTVQHKPAVPERQGINPFTKEETTFKAKPARDVIKVRPLKALKDMTA